MSAIKNQTAGVCVECGKETDIDSPIVCFGCVSAEQAKAQGVEVPEFDSCCVSPVASDPVPF
jgi:hypothetical protein